MSTGKFIPAIAELMVIAIVLRLLGLVQPFVFQTIIDRVLPFQREATLVLIVVLLVATTLFSAGLGAISAFFCRTIWQTHSQWSWVRFSEIGTNLYCKKCPRKRY